MIKMQPFLGQKTSSRRKRINAVLLWILIPTLLWSLLTLEQRSLYQPDRTSYNDPGIALSHSPLKQKIQNIYFQTRDGIKINGWYVSPQSGKSTIVFAHGNGGNQGDRLDVLSAFTERGYGFLSFDYQGYGSSEGTASEAGLYKDMEAASLYLDAQGIPIQRQIAMGESLGSGVVVDVATRIPYQAVILYASFTSTPSVASALRDKNGWGWLSFLPLNVIMQQHFDSLSKMQRVTSPVLIIHGDHDEMMPLSMPKALFARALNRHKKLLIIPGAGHNSVFQMGQSRILQTLDSFLSELTQKTTSRLPE